MKTRLRYLFKICFLGFILIVTELSYSQQKNIIINKDLSNNADMMKVKMGTQWMGRIWNIKFGDYAVVRKSKMSIKTTKGWSNILGTKSEYTTGYNFNFILSEKDIDSANVNAVYVRNVKEIHSFANFFGRDEVLTDSINFIAEISLRSNMKEIWRLILDITSGTETDIRHEGVLTNGNRILLVNSVNSNRDGNDNRQYPALGYEFTENGKAISAVQYLGGGAFGYNKNRVWIDSRLKQEMKLILAASMTAILQEKY